MRKKGLVASALFAALCLGGITTLISQANLPTLPITPAAGNHTVTLDPVQNPSKRFEGIAPLSLKKGAEVQTPPAVEERKGSGRILRLR